MTEIVVSDYSQPINVINRVDESLKNFLSPLVFSAEATRSDAMTEDWDGWPFGRPLFLSEIYSLVQKVPGVKHVLDVQLAWRPVIPAKENQQPAAPEGAAADYVPPEKQLKIVEQKKIDIPADALICSLEHDIKIAEL